MKKNNIIKCPYCGGTAVLRDTTYVFGPDATPGRLYVCQHFPDCNAYVSVHKGTLTPRGTLANGDLRHKRIEAHRTFDQIWLSGILTKQNAYRWMQDKFALSEKQAHIGYFSEYMCDRLIEESNKVLENWKQGATNSPLVGSLPFKTEVVPKTGCRHCRRKGGVHHA